MSEAETEAGALKLVGGRLSLDFANTIDWHESEDPADHLSDYGALLDWSEHAGTLAAAQAQALRHGAAAEPEAAQAVLARAVALREALYRVFLAVTAGTPPAPDDMRLVNEELARALRHLQLAFAGEGMSWRWPQGEDALERVLWPLVRDAADLLTSEQVERVKRCDGHHCSWLFLDTSRNRSRRWCSMEDCGNRAKARRYYRRQRTEQ
jgi:predicted RNA-binding Zn ribbon-like protein